eukprot:3409158-Prymnesium_polylepis.1
MGRLALLRRIRDEAIKIEKGTRRRQATLPFLRWFEGEEGGGSAPQGSFPDISRRGEEPF